jgi:hypothetical protein
MSASHPSEAAWVKRADLAESALADTCNQLGEALGKITFRDERIAILERRCRELYDALASRSSAPPALPVPAQEAEALVAAFELSLLASDSFVGRGLFRREILAGLVDAARYRVLRDSLDHDRDEIGITFPAPRFGGGLVYSPAQLDAALDERLRASRSPEETPDAEVER